MLYYYNKAHPLYRRGRLLVSENRPLNQRLQQVLEFPLASGIFGRRSRRFGFGMTIPSGPLAYTSQHEPLPLCELEPALLLAAGTEVTGRNFGTPFTVNQSDALSNYSLRMTGARSLRLPPLERVNCSLPTTRVST